MAFGTTRVLKVLVDVKGAKELQGLGGNLSRVGQGLTLGVTVPLVAAGVAVTKLGSEAQTADAKLQAVFKSMKSRAFTTIPVLEDQATALAKATQFDDEAIKEGQATLLTFGKITGASFDRAVEGATNMAAFFKTDVTVQAQRLGKALQDPIKGLGLLSRAGIVFTDEQKATIQSMVDMGDIAGAQNIILTELEKRYGGVAAAIGATDAGKFAQAMEEIGEAGESVGVILLPVISSISGVLRTLAEGFQALPGPVQGAVVALLTVAATVGPLLLIGSKLIGAFGLIKLAILNIPTALGFMDLAFAKTGAAFNALKLLFLANPWIALAAAVIAIAALIILNWDKIVGFLTKVWDNIKHALSGLVDFFSTMWRNLVTATTQAWSTVVGIIRGVINGIIDVINGLFGFLNSIQIGIPEINVGPVHIGGGVIDPFNIGLIPHLAAGGIIDSPTLALLGESGPEAVVPLDRNMGEQHFHSHIEVRGEEPFIRDEAGLVRVQQRIAFLEGF